MKRAAPKSEFISKKPATDAQWTGDKCTIDVDTVTHVSASFVRSPKQTTHISASFASIPAVTASQSSSQQEASSPELSAEQFEVLKLVRQGRNVFFTGNAGTGKTFLLSRIIEGHSSKQMLPIVLEGRMSTSIACTFSATHPDFRQQYGTEFNACVALCATTGIAATHIQGGFQVHVQARCEITHPQLAGECTCGGGAGASMVDRYSMPLAHLPVIRGQTAHSPPRPSLGPSLETDH
ncbi:ATP-dependent DNA helicase [Haematococcus lacustris]|uniref:ATP-dependent DNA helicase n=1 Tax=Haematococcus lacustris TaxID=44745 RepID=A0A699YM70_HAELA|nr:ATP-dependent DNA helicase [Haematococcus lacustris]